MGTHPSKACFHSLPSGQVAGFAFDFGASRTGGGGGDGARAIGAVVGRFAGSARRGAFGLRIGGAVVGSHALRVGFQREPAAQAEAASSTQVAVA
jgi:hypothetical protein